MPATILDGAAVARRILADTSARAHHFRNHHGRKPCLATVLIGDDPASHTYVRMKANRCAGSGLDSRRVHLPAGAHTADAVRVVAELSADPDVDGILVQHPAPAHVDERAVFEAIDPDKDVDGVTAASFGASCVGVPGHLACTPAGIMRLLDAYDIDVTGRHAVVVGASVILGRPLGMLLLAREATVTYCHKRTRDLAGQVANAELVVAAAGVPELILGEWLQPGAVVVDAGYHPTKVGDVHFASAVQRASAITPVPGGVGPMTIAVLLDQTVCAAEGRATRIAA